MIKSFRDKLTESLFNGEVPKGAIAQIARIARRKLEMVNAATVLDDLRSPPGNRLEELIGDRAGQHSIRINKKYRVCFTWTDAGPEDVEVCDYH